jgi:hypothetical protein
VYIAAEQSQEWFAGVINSLLSDCILKVDDDDDDDDDDWMVPSTFHVHCEGTDTVISIQSVQFFRFIVL